MAIDSPLTRAERCQTAGHCNRRAMVNDQQPLQHGKDIQYNALL